MKSIKTYQCECGEDFYEDDVNCLNCGEPIDKSKLKDEEVADIKYTKREIKIIAYAGFVDNKLDFGWIENEKFLDGLYGIFRTKKEAKKHYQQVKKVEIKIIK